MNRLSAHIGYLYTDLPLADRLAAAAVDGFTAVEHPEPWAIPAPEMAQRLADLNLTFSQVTTGMGDPARQEKGLAALPNRTNDLRAAFDRALTYADTINCPFIHPMAGITTAPEAADTYQANLRWALAQLQNTNQRLLIEAITLPNYHLATLHQAAAMQDQLPEIALLFDTYHAATLGHDSAAWITENPHRIGHIHIADHPGRHQPGTGTLNFPAILQALIAINYPGAIGFEYLPTTPDSTRFLPAWKAQLSAGAST
ncbi:TIM barrel protein [Cypionkella sp.]|uniref:hydroxypyruvate isomerase family protein n=1 Tax=Cypionkella sp. TaxID=2811411 RepID=UPI002626C61E|nr:TIM barrel protein [Cypionkella sp.]MDB5664609.1 hydroxypyruvate isomerase [Cypionkella sp.]